MKDTLILYSFSRSQVERCDFRAFIDHYAPDRLPSGRRLREMMNTLILSVAGYDHDPREVYAIPEIRRFFQEFHKAWPYWLFFCNFDSNQVNAVFLCLLNSISAVKIDQKQDVEIKIIRGELLNILIADSDPLKAMFDRSKMFDRGIYDRTKKIYDHFDLPLNVPTAASSPR
jgi:hypothetical protein